MMTRKLSRIPRRLRRKMRSFFRIIDSTVDHEGRTNLESLMVYLKGREAFLTHIDLHTLLQDRRKELFAFEDDAVSSMVDFFVMFEMLENADLYLATAGPLAGREHQAWVANLGHMTDAFTAILPRWDNTGIILIRALGG